MHVHMHFTECKRDHLGIRIAIVQEDHGEKHDAVTVLTWVLEACYWHAPLPQYCHLYGRKYCCSLSVIFPPF